MELCLCLVVFLFRNIADFGNFWSNFCLLHSSYWIYDHFFALNHGTQICFLCETQKCGKKLNNTWMTMFYIGILPIFVNFWANNICLVHSPHCLSGCIFVWNHCGLIFSFRITQKIVPVWKYVQTFCQKQKLTKIAKFEINLGYHCKFWTNWVHDKYNINIT